MTHDDTSHQQPLSGAGPPSGGGPPASAKQASGGGPLVGGPGTGIRDWRGSEPFPGADTPAQLREAFRIVNAWARELKEWGIGVQSAFLAIQARGAEGLQADDVKKLKPYVARDIHDVASAQEVLGIKKATQGQVGGAADVVGHPPDPPFQDPILPDP